MSSAAILPNQSRVTPFRAILFAIFALIVCAFIFGGAMWQEVHQDEHQFVAPATVFARHGLLPYKDFPLFHTPNLVFVYGALDKVFTSPLLAARSFCVLCFALTALLLGWQTRASLIQRPAWTRDVASICAVLFFVTAAVFANVARLAWNHALPMLLVVCAFLLHIKAARQKRGGAALFVSGICLGFAIGTRISFAPLVAPFGLAVFLLPNFRAREKWHGAALFSAGVLLAMLPSLWLLAKYPEQFWFGNFTYPKLSLIWRRHPMNAPDLAQFADSQRGFFDPLHEGMKGLPLREKMRSFWSETVKPNGPIFIVFTLVGLPACCCALVRNWRAHFNVLLLFLVLPFLLMGCIAPSRYHVQYFYPLLPFLILGSAFGFGFLENRIAKISAGFAAIMCVVALAICSYQPFAMLLTPSKWAPIRAHAAGVEIRRLIGGTGKVLTFAPMIPQEGGVDIYPEFALGPFAWRSAHLIPADKRQRLHLVSVFDIDALLASDPPRAIYLREKDTEINVPLLHFAKAHNYTRHTVGGYVLWVAPEQS